MPKRGVSVTLRDENLLWLKSRTVATKGRSLSETLDELVTAARTSRDVPAAAVRSVVGTVDIAADGIASVAALGTMLRARAARPGLVAGDAVELVLRPEAIEIVPPRPSYRALFWARRSNTCCGARTRRCRPFATTRDPARSRRMERLCCYVLRRTP